MELLKIIYKRKFLPLLGLCQFRRNKYCTVIYYHDIVTGAGQTFLKMNINQFKQQMDYLSANGYETMRFDDFSNPERLNFSQKKILIAFDDGWLSNYIEIFDYMKVKNIKYNIFLAVGKIGNNPDFITWDMAREMHSSGLVGFGTHTYSHINIKDIDNIDVKKEIDLADEIFEREMGYRAGDFCYPYGGYSAQSNEFLVNKTNYKRIYQSDHIFSYDSMESIIFGRNGISSDYPMSFFKIIVKGYNNGTANIESKIRTIVNTIRR